jgi:hypothetical protein
VIDHYHGIVVVRQRHQDRDTILATVRRLIPVFWREVLAGTLWIVSTDSIRVRE